MHEPVAVVIPSLGNPSLVPCLAALSAQSLRPDRIIVVLSGGALPLETGSETEWIVNDQRLGFAAAVNRGLRKIGDSAGFIALLNDDAVPSPQWLETLVKALETRDDLGAVQGTVTTSENPPLVDGRGLGLTHFGLPVQLERGAPADDTDREIEEHIGVSATAALFRSSALKAAQLNDGSVFDEAFDSYHEDTDLALRLGRIGKRSAWVPGALCCHLGSASGGKRSWRHPWWILSNRWRVLAGNLTPVAFVLAFPRLIRGEVRAVRTLSRSNPRTFLIAPLIAAMLPLFKVQGWLRQTPGPRLKELPRSPE